MFPAVHFVESVGSPRVPTVPFLEYLGTPGAPVVPFSEFRAIPRVPPHRSFFQNPKDPWGPFLVIFSEFRRIPRGTLPIAPILESLGSLLLPFWDPQGSLGWLVGCCHPLRNGGQNTIGGTIVTCNQVHVENISVGMKRTHSARNLRQSPLPHANANYNSAHRG